MHESNTFISTPTTLEDFRRAALLMGDAIVEHWGEAPHEIGGFIEGVRSAGGEPVLILSAWAMPGGTVAAKTYDTMLKMMMDGLDRAGSLDGLPLAPHGAGVSENHPDMDGHWLSLVRERMGAYVPMISTLDPHTNLSPTMIDACNANIAYRTNPHLDQRKIGLHAADLMVRTLRGEIRPTQAASFPAIAINIEKQMTAESPCRPMYDYADKMLERPGVLSNSVVLGFAFADVAEMGTSFTVVTDNDEAMAQQYADQLAGYLWEHRREFVANLTGTRLSSLRCGQKNPFVRGIMDGMENPGRLLYRWLSVALVATVVVFAIAVYGVPYFKDRHNVDVTRVRPQDANNRPTAILSPLLDLEGRKVDPIRSQGDRAIVYLFTRSDCPISNRYAPEIQKLQAQFKPQGVSFCLVYPDPRATADSIRQHMQEYGYTCQALRDPEHVLVRWTGARVTPEAVVVLPSHEIAYRGRIDDRWVEFGTARRSPTRHDLKAALTAILAGKSIAVATTSAVGCFIKDLK